MTALWARVEPLLALVQKSRLDTSVARTDEIGLPNPGAADPLETLTSAATQQLIDTTETGARCSPPADGDVPPTVVNALATAVGG